MKMKPPVKAEVFYDHFNQTLHNAGVSTQGGSAEPLKDQHGYLPARILQSVLTMQTKLGEVIETKTRLTAEKQKADETHRATREKLETTVRNYWSVVRLRVSRGELPQSIFPTFGLMANGRNPESLKTALWPVFAETAIKAEAEIAAQGHEPTTAPNSENIRQVLDDFTAARAAKHKSGTALTTYKQQEIQSLLFDATRLYQLVMGELRRELRDYAASERRQIMRNYGAEFVAPADETAEPETPSDGETPTTEPAANEPAA